MEVKFNYYGREVLVSPEVAAFLKESNRQIRNSNERYGENHVELKYMDPDNTLDTEHCTGRNYLLNVVARNERSEIVRNIVELLPEQMQSLFHLRYEYDYTEQKIGDMEGVTKMAICKRLKKLHALVLEKLPYWIIAEYIQEEQNNGESEQQCSDSFCFFTHSNFAWFTKALSHPLYIGE